MAAGFAKKGLWSAPTVYATDDELRYVAVCACADFINETPTDNLANANLVAAAPELLEALKAYHEHFGVLEDNHMIHEEARRCCKLARAAIAKAEGTDNG